MGNRADVSFRNLSHADLLRTVKLCEQLHRADPGMSFVLHCQDVMEDLFSHVHFTAERQRINPFKMLEKPNDTVDEKFLPLFYEHVHEHPVVDRLLNFPKSEIGMTQFEPTVREYRTSVLYNEFYDRIESQNQIWSCIVEDNEMLICAYSRVRKYTQNDFAIMHIIQPHLELAWKHWKHWKQTRSLKEELGVLKDSIFQSEEQKVEAARLRRMIDALPPRQREVVERVAAGLDNQQIANELNISKRTVQKHLELIFHAMAVLHRTELASKWHQAHSVQIY